ncbi:MAG TPA: hypothetical protein VFT99_24875, partial [Roseiflexaceae bacterium]|nr:hypothetical protein [Roseiflexaceae bacterium]
MTEPHTPLPPIEPFPSLAALRAAHNELLKATRDTSAVRAQLDAIRDFIGRGAATGALLDEEDDRETAQNLLDYWSATAYRVGSEAPDATLAEYNSAFEPELRDDQCPYVGLEPFTERTSQWFFGRLRLIPFLVNKIQSLRMVALVGPLGSGKTSALRAGLLPALLNGATDEEHWRALPPMTPGADPL